ncbi:hypothetical protein VPH35_134798 [Triticum aestivum]
MSTEYVGMNHNCIGKIQLGSVHLKMFCADAASWASRAARSMCALRARARKTSPAAAAPSTAAASCTSGRWTAGQHVTTYRHYVDKFIFNFWAICLRTLC